MSWISGAWKLGGLDGKTLGTFKGSVFLPFFICGGRGGVLRKASEASLAQVWLLAREAVRLARD